MVKKIIGPLAVFICLSWIAFVVSEIIQKKKDSDFILKHGGAIKPSDEEILENPRSRSSRMRVAVRL